MDEDLGPARKARRELIERLYDLVKTGNEEQVKNVLTDLSTDMLQFLVDQNASSKISVLYGCHVVVKGKKEPCAYALFRSKFHEKIPEFLLRVDWKEIMGALRNQGDHDICWAVVVSELVRAMKIIFKLETDEDLLYSPQDLVDFVDQVRRKTLNKVPHHYCYPNSMANGFDYVRDNGLQREEDRPLIGCSVVEPAVYRNPASLDFIKGYERACSVGQMFTALKGRPIGASLAIFRPEFYTRSKQMYRGAESHGSTFLCSHAVSITSVGEENGERFAWVRSSEGDEVGNNGYYKVSLDAHIMHLPRADEKIAPFNRRFSTPSPVLSNFVYPIPLTREEEENKRSLAIRGENRKGKRPRDK